MNHAATLAAAAGLAIAATAHAQSDRFWAAPVNGLWTLDTNWSPMDVPSDPTENAVIDLPGTYTINLPLSTQSINALSLINPDTTLIIDPSATLQIAALTNNGFIRLNPSFSSANAVVTVATNTLFTGTGILELSGGSNDAQLDSAAGTITNDTNHTIRGAGELLATITNNGLIEARNTGFDGVLELDVNDKANNATIASSPNAILQIEDITITQSPSGVIDAAGGIVRFQQNNTIVGGSIAASTGGTITRQLGTTTLNNVILDADFTVDPSGTLVSVGDMFINNANVRLNPSFSSANAVLTFDANALITGTGAIQLFGGTNDSSLDTAPGITITVDAGHTVQGAGEVNAALINNGLIEARNFGFANVLELQNNDKVNNAIIASSANATLQIEDITIDQSAGGTIDANGGIVFFQGTNNALLGGTITATGGGTITRQFGTSTFTDVTLQAEMTLDPSGTINLLGTTFTNNALLRVNPSFSSANGILNAVGNITLDGTGEVALGGGPDDSQLTTDTIQPSSLVNGPDHTISGSGTINALMTNQGTIRAENTGFANILDLTGLTITNNGSIASAANTILNIQNITIDGTGTIDTADGTINFQTSTSSTIGANTIESTAGGTIRRQVGTTTFRGTTLNTDLAVDASGTVELAGNGLTNNAEIILNASFSSANAILNFAADTLLGGAGTVDLAGGINDAQITTNEGVTGTIGAGQILIGTGDLTGSFILAATLAPDGEFANGSTIGRFDLRGPGVDFTPDTNLMIDVQSATLFDQLNRPANDAPVHLAGHLHVTANPAGSYTLGQELDIIEQGGAITGDFDSTNVASVFINDDVALRVVKRPNEVVLRVINFDCLADFQAPLDVLDLTDVDDFIAAFLIGDPIADIAPPTGIIDLSDVDLFIQLFLSGCL